MKDMAEQMGTPGSNADTSVNGGKLGAPKDKACPFCRQQFTSSSLGRHLDLYIKEKNPKPADGIHHVDEIRKMRGGITRRQPRNSTSRREDSTPVDTPGAQERRSPRPESEVQGNRSPSLRRDDAAGSDLIPFGGKSKWMMNKATWESTGVMNHIPAVRNGDSVRSVDGDDRDVGRRVDSRGRSVSKQMLAKTTFEQKQKMMEALDNARAAELALREILGSFRAAKQRIEGPSIFDYDPLTLDFPSLTLHCLPPPPTLHQSTPLPNSSSWSILPPDEQQYQALRNHFSAEFHRWRVSCAIATTAPRDDLSYPPQPHLFAGLDDPTDIAQRAESEAAELETKISEHLHSVFAHWTSLPPAKRSEIWILELARSVGRKSEENQKLKKEKELSQQETEHLRLQVDELSRIQHPREFRLVPPSTIPFDRSFIADMGEMGVNKKGVGWDLVDRNQHIDTVIERAIGRWKGIVKGAREGGGMAAQRSLSGESAPASALSTSASKMITNATNNNPNQNHNPNININHTTSANQTNGTDAIGSDQDADADADMEEDDSYVEMTDAARAPEAPMGANFRLSNGNGNANNQSGGGVRMEGMENQTIVQGYVRIGA